MLLRRVIEHVKTQNWTAVALDFVIVVVGVFIGIQVANWNDARANDARIERRLDNLADDLRADIVEMEFISKNAIWRSSATAEVLMRSGHSQVSQYETPDGRILTALPIPAYEAELPTTAHSAITWLSTLDGNRGSYDALVSTGDLHVMSNTDLARQIQNYYARADEIYDTDRAHQDSHDLVTTALHRNGVGIFSDVALDQLVQKVRDDQQLAASLSTMLASDDQQRLNMRELIGTAEALIAQIEREN